MNRPGDETTLKQQSSNNHNIGWLLLPTIGGLKPEWHLALMKKRKLQTLKAESLFYFAWVQLGAQVSALCSNRFLLHISCQSSVLDGPVDLSVVETNAFKHLNHLSLRLVQGSDKEIKEYLALCLSSLKVPTSPFISLKAHRVTI